MPHRPRLTSGDRPGAGTGEMGVVPVQTSRQQDLGALALVLGVLLVLLVTSIALGSPAIR
jgi:hypothetical protein